MDFHRLHLAVKRSMPASRKVKLQSLARRQLAGKPSRQWRDERRAEISSDIQGSRRLRSDP
jgi:hypothetical protein